MFQWTPDIIPSSVFIVGCGGTGSRTLQPILQLMDSQSWLKVTGASVYLVDGDEVEAKNTTRQLFIERDIGKNKAVVLASRYRTFYPDINLVALPVMLPNNTHDFLKAIRALPDEHKLTDIEINNLQSNVFGMSPKIDLPNMPCQDTWLSQHGASYSAVRRQRDEDVAEAIPRHRAPVVIMCVDTPAARRTILALFSANPNTVFIDAGNEDIFGQVSIFSNKVAPVIFRDLEDLTVRMTGKKDGARGHYFGDARYGVDSSPQVSKETVMEGIRFTNALLEVTPDMMCDRVSLDGIPMPVWRYLTAQEEEGTKSCADLDQTLAINNMMAALIVTFFQNLIFSQPFTYHTVRASSNGAYSSEFMDMKWMKRVLRGQEESYMGGLLGYIADMKELTNEGKVLFGEMAWRRGEGSAMALTKNQRTQVYDTMVIAEHKLGRNIFVHDDARKAFVTDQKIAPDDFTTMPMVAHSLAKQFGKEDEWPSYLKILLRSFSEMVQISAAETLKDALISAHNRLDEYDMPPANKAAARAGLYLLANFTASHSNMDRMLHNPSILRPILPALTNGDSFIAATPEELEATKGTGLGELLSTAVAVASGTATERAGGLMYSVLLAGAGYLKNESEVVAEVSRRMKVSEDQVRVIPEARKELRKRLLSSINMMTGYA